MSAVAVPETWAGLMARFCKGDRAAADQLVEVFYPELRKLAASKMKGERSDHTWQPTLLVNELYLALVKMKALGVSGLSSDQEKAAFLGFAGHVMKRLLIEHARPLHRRVEKVQFNDRPELAGAGAQGLHEVEVALSRLGAIDPKFRTVVEMRVFEGLTGDEIAARLGCSPRSIATYWSFAKRWLQNELADSRHA
jgi:RNA polymerase sigma factor (TIGR02999 family)